MGSLYFVVLARMWHEPSGRLRFCVSRPSDPYRTAVDRNWSLRLSLFPFCTARMWGEPARQAETTVEPGGD
jgi:hypothetical protein